jgi:hypothetical protein
MDEPEVICIGSDDEDNGNNTGDQQAKQDSTVSTTSSSVTGQVFKKEKRDESKQHFISTFLQLAFRIKRDQ